MERYTVLLKKKKKEPVVNCRATCIEMIQLAFKKKDTQTLTNECVCAFMFIYVCSIAYLKPILKSLFEKI